MTKTIRLGVLTLVALVALGIVSAAVAHRVVVIKGTKNGETLTGTAGNDRIHARAGDDTVNAGDGHDRVFGQHGNDTLNGEGGNDRMRGGPGNDTLNGGEGNDVLRGRWGNDVINGDNGNDIIWAGRGADVVNGGAGNDRIHVLARDRQVDRVDCGEGNRDVVWLNARESDVHVNCEIVKTVSTSYPDDGE
ncbi:MAG TPA: calcium-binding protein [Gaiellaceae bacterium]